MSQLSIRLLCNSACKRNRSTYCVIVDLSTAMEVLPGVFASTSPCAVISSKSSVRIASSLIASLSVSVPPSLALNYNDVVTRADNATTQAASVDLIPLFAGVAVAVAVAVPLIAFRNQSFGSASAVAAFTALSEPDANAQLLDARLPEDVKATGSPNLKALRKKPVQVAYKREDGDEMFVNKVLAKCRDPENTILYVLDDGLDGDNALAVAKLLAKSGFQKSLAIAGGVAGWQKSELPWLEPRKAFTLNMDGLKNLLSGSSENPNLVPTTLGAAAAAGIGLAVFTEAETVLQLLGSAAFIQIFARKFMFADDREKSIKEIQTFLDTKIAPKEFAAELKEAGKVLLPEVKAAVASGNAAVEKKLNVNSSATPASKLADQVKGA